MANAARKVIVTGGAGFIGSHTAVELHAAGYVPVVVDNFCASERSVVGRLEHILGSPLSVHDVDCRDRARLQQVFEKEGPIFGVIHFAAHKAVGVSVQDPLAYYDNNLGSLVAILASMQEAQVTRFVFSSSCTVYGQPERLPVTEESPFRPAESPYGRSKQFSEAIIGDVVRSGKLLHAVTLRYFNPVGAHPSALIGELPLGKPENLVPFITQAAVGLREELTVFGNDYPTRDGTCVRDYIHVLDLAHAHVAALDWLGTQVSTAQVSTAQVSTAQVSTIQGPATQAVPPSFNEVFNLGTGAGVSVLEAIQAFEAATGTKLRYRVGPRRPGDVVEIYANVDKAQRLLGWSTRRSIVDAMRDAYNWECALAAKRSS